MLCRKEGGPTSFSVRTLIVLILIDLTRHNHHPNEEHRPDNPERENRIPALTYKTKSIQLASIPLIIPNPPVPNKKPQNMNLKNAGKRIQRTYKYYSAATKPTSSHWVP